MKQPTPRQQGVYAAGRMIIGSMRAAIEQRGISIATDLAHQEIGNLVRLALDGKIEQYNDQLDGFADALGEFIYRTFYEDEILTEDETD